VRGGIARADDPNGIAEREFQLIYGNNSPMPGRWSMRRWTTFRVRICSVSLAVVHPNNMILGIVGDFDLRGMQASSSKEVWDWKPSQMPLPAIGVSV